MLTVAVAETILNGGDYTSQLHKYYELYPRAGYGQSFATWAKTKQQKPYNSWGNGSAMRVSPVGFACDSLAHVWAEAKRSAAVTHNHPYGIRGAQATAAAIFLARKGHGKRSIKRYVEEMFGYNLQASIEEIRPRYVFDISCQGSVPQSIIAFLESNNYEQAVRNAISLGGDADTMACIAGGIAEAFYGGVPRAIKKQAMALLDRRLRRVVKKFSRRYS